MKRGKGSRGHWRLYTDDIRPDGFMSYDFGMLSINRSSVAGVCLWKLLFIVSKASPECRCPP